MLVRRERPEDVRAVRRIHAAAFPADVDGTVVEAALVDALRASPDWLPALSLVADVGGTLVGHVVCSRAWVAGRAAVLGLGPIGVVPGYQRRGVGTALVHAVVAAAEARDEALVGVLGEPRFYARFGFVAAGRLGIGAPDPTWGDAFQVRPLRPGEPAVSGPFAYAPPFAVG
jgi:putative acetyltransferase